MAEAQELSPTPPLPRSLKTVKGARAELVRLYVRLMRGEVEPAVVGKGSHILSLLISSSRDCEFEERLRRVEADMAAAKGRPNGHDREGARP